VVLEGFQLHNIDLDLASSRDANQIVQAHKYFNASFPCPPEWDLWNRVQVVGRDDTVHDIIPAELTNQVDLDHAPTVWCNPPGPSKNVKKFWDVWCKLTQKCHFHGAFLLYSVDHIRMLHIDADHTYDIGAHFIRERLKFTGNKHSSTIGSVLFTHGWQHDYWPQQMRF
jgi:hypothetical protein